jgi:hypothetical protein
MNWLIREKMFTHFYNKLRPVNRMHCTKYYVNSSLHISGYCRRCVAPWITVLSRYTLFTTRVIYKFTWCDIPRNKAPHTGPHDIWCINTSCPFSGHEKNTDGSEVWLMISLESSCYGDSCIAKHLLRPNLVFQPFWGWGDLGTFQLPQSNSSTEGA